MLFTLAITVWRREEMLPHAIQTVLNQTHRNWEILVYSDGTSRATQRIVAALEPEIPIRYEPLKRRRGHWGNHLRRRALEQGSGSHVCFLGHDCLLYPTYLETHLANVGAAPHALSVVPIDYWRETWRDVRQPRNPDLMNLRDGEIDLLCVAYPRQLALEADCFGADMQRLRYADYLSFERLRKLTPPIYRPGPSQAAHF